MWALVRISSGGVGVFHVKGWGAKKFDMSLETQGIKPFWRDIPGFFAGISRDFLPGYPGSARKV